MRQSKRLLALAGTLALCCTLALPIYAHDAPDESRTGSISFTMTYDEEAVGGGALTLYRVGDIAEDDGNYSFVLSDAYKDCDVSLADVNAPELADALTEYTTAHPTQGITVKIASDGTARAEDLVLGLYLVVQHSPASGYEPIRPFLVSVPIYDDEKGVYLYNVDAVPKIGELSKVPPESSTPATPVPSGAPVTTTSTATTSAPQTTLPQTGQLNWPVPVLTIAGLLLLLVGWYLRAGSRQGNPHAA